jgi:AcrR family transcriptional regulator
VVRFSNARSNRADRRRAEILRAAARVFRARGFAAAGMREIAVAAELSPANLYHYFAGKNELLYFCQDRTLDTLLDAVADAAHGRGPLPLRLRQLAATHVRCLLDDVEGAAAHIEVDALPPKLRAAIVAKRDRYERAVRALIAAGIRRRELTRTDATIATRAFLGALNWTAQWFRPEGPDHPEHIAEVVAGFAVAGLGTRGHDRGNLTARQRRAGERRVRSPQNAARGSS